MNEYHKCHKCGGQGIFLDSQEVGWSANGWAQECHDFECEDCGATWDVTVEMTPVSRENHES
jgi:hypothetical protein